MSSDIQAEARRPAWGQWLLALGVAVAGGAMGGWANSLLGSSLPVLLFLLIAGAATLLGGAILDSWWALAALPVGVLVGMGLAFLSVPLATYLPTVLGSWLVVGLPVAVVGAFIGVRLRRFVSDRVQQVPWTDHDATA